MRGAHKGFDANIERLTLLELVEQNQLIQQHDTQDEELVPTTHSNISSPT